jgi:hypothetical protein
MGEDLVYMGTSDLVLLKNWKTYLHVVNFLSH